MRPLYQSVQDLLLEFSSLTGVSEESARLKKARQEIDPLQSKTDNPVKKAARATVKARRTGDTDDIAGASSRTRVATMYAKTHGYPNLVKQLGKHKETLRKFATATRKREIHQGKAARKRRMQDLKTKLSARRGRRRSR